MGTISLQIPQTGQPNASEDPKIASDMTTIQTWANGNIDATNLSSALAQSASVNVSGGVAKGSSIIATTETTTSNSLGTLPTPDQVQNIVLPTPGLIAVWYQATWKESVAGAALAEIFLGSNGVKVAQNEGTTGLAQGLIGNIGGTAGTTVPLATYSGGLTGIPTRNSSNYVGDATTGQLIGASDFGGTFQAGGPCYIFAAPGTYTLSVQFKSNGSATVTVSNRRLYVCALSFT